MLYLFSDATQKLPTWAVTLAECQGARRSLNSGRPYCFELLLRTGALQLAAPDEYVASDWLQALVQAASGVSFFTMNIPSVPPTLNLPFYQKAALRTTRTTKDPGLHADYDLESPANPAGRFWRPTPAEHRLLQCKFQYHGIPGQGEHQPKCSTTTTTTPTV